MVHPPTIAHNLFARHLWWDDHTGDSFWKFYSNFTLFWHSSACWVDLSYWTGCRSAPLLLNLRGRLHVVQVLYSYVSIHDGLKIFKNSPLQQIACKTLFYKQAENLKFEWADALHGSNIENWIEGTDYTDRGRSEKPNKGWWYNSDFGHIGKLLPLLGLKGQQDGM